MTEAFPGSMNLDESRESKQYYVALASDCVVVKVGGMMCGEDQCRGRVTKLAPC